MIPSVLVNVKVSGVVIVVMSLLGVMMGVNYNSNLMLWMTMEVYTFSVLLFNLYLNSSPKSLMSLLNYFLVQSLSGVIILFLCLLEISISSGYNSMLLPTGAACKYLWSGAVMLKVSLFPFYYQVVYVFYFLSPNQNLVISTLAKIMPLVMFTVIIGNLSIYFIFCVVFFSVMLSGMMSMWGSNVHEILGWSTISHTGWLMLAVMGGVYMFFYYMTFYVMGVSILWLKLSGVSSNYFLNMGSMFKMESEYTLLLALWLVLCGVAPLVSFILKLLVLTGLMASAGVEMVLLTLGSASMGVFMYLRLVQFINSVKINMYYLREYSAGKSGFMWSELMLVVLMATGLGLIFI